ncbi:MAG: nicotinate-nucleotide--dimethylbenzimidazole phosphoribosyltransferase [Rhodospirillaceae bacterium]|nr:nicotinate-nucleotide--dimethylbenzimidazole phosphoribosyltransferase [Rhodospirillaceae bacterium]MBL6941847.1 nicotinate-nucleotide--dimethylbenzimidazole phosphoribosyltransferase [Rhodospirillales bacterium]
MNSLNDVRTLLATLPDADEQAQAQAVEREPQLTKPPGSLGRLEALSHWLAAWQGRHPPRMETPRAHVFAGNHGVTERGVSAYPAAVTEQMVGNFKAGGAAINQLCKTFGISLAVDALELDRPTADFTTGPAMSEAETVQAMARGMAVVEDDCDVLCLGEMGIGNTTSAAAICHALYGGGAADWTGPGTGVEGEAMTIKIGCVEDAVKLHSGGDGLDILMRLGGRELAAIAGAIIAARLKRVPVLLDGYVCSAAASVLEATAKGALDHCQVGHVSSEPGHLRLLQKLDKTALINFEMRLGEASGAALAVGLLKAAVACHGGMATFAEAGVSDKD